MNTLVFALFVIGLVFLGLEVVLPGAILGIAGGLFLIGGVAVAWLEHGAQGGAIAFAVAVAAVGGLLFLELKVVPRTRLGRRLFLTKAIDGASQPPVAERADDVVGHEAVALTPLAPTGLVQVAGRRYEARCDSGFAPEGARLRVVRVETFQLVVIQSG
jgi:membrane-bound ClpP family serine protease